MDARLRDNAATTNGPRAIQHVRSVSGHAQQLLLRLGGSCIERSLFSHGGIVGRHRTIDNITFVVRNDESSQRQSNDQSEESKQRAPHRQRQEYDGGVKSHEFTHDFRGDDKVLQSLDNAIYGSNLGSNNPEARSEEHTSELQSRI